MTELSPAAREALAHRWRTQFQAAQALLIEANAAAAKHPKLNSAHEGWAVIREEVDELWEEVKANRGRSAAACAEAVQIGAMCLRYISELCGELDPEPDPEGHGGQQP